MSTTHVAVNAVKIKEREIQRCGLCGALLVQNIPGKREEGIRPKMPTWPLGTLVRIDPDGRQTPDGFATDDKALPEDLCLKDVPC